MDLSRWNSWTWDFLQVLRRPIETTRLIVRKRALPVSADSFRYFQTD